MFRQGKNVVRFYPGLVVLPLGFDPKTAKVRVMRHTAGYVILAFLALLFLSPPLALFIMLPVIIYAFVKSLRTSLPIDLLTLREVYREAIKKCSETDDEETTVEVYSLTYKVSCVLEKKCVESTVEPGAYLISLALIIVTPLLLKGAIPTWFSAFILVAVAIGFYLNVSCTKREVIRVPDLLKSWSNK